MYLYVVRHGQTDWNLEERVQGTMDVPLNETGKKQAISLSEKLYNIPIDFIFCSPLKRTLETAFLLNSRNLPIFIDERLKERNYGEFEGLVKTDFDMDLFWDYDADVQYKSAENVRKCVMRVYEFLEELKEKYPNKSILLVTHGGLIRVIDGYFRNQTDGKFVSAGLKNGEIREYLI